MKKILLTTLLALCTMNAMAKSVVFTLNDKVGTRVYYRLDGDTSPKLAINGDGTFSVNGTEYEFANIKNFYISNTDYSGENNTVDAIEAPRMVLENGKLSLSGNGKGVKIYTLDGRLVKTQAKASQIDISRLPAGGYVISDGVSTLKIQKR